MRLYIDIYIPTYIYIYIYTGTDIEMHTHIQIYITSRWPELAGKFRVELIPVVVL